MANKYLAVSDYGKAVFGEEPFDQEFTPSDEADHLNAGHLELVPRTYRQLSNNYSAAKQGDTFLGALVVDHESALIQGGHIERVDKPATTTKRKAD